MSYLTEADKALIHEVAKTAAKSAVEETFVRFGLDSKDPISSQALFSNMRSLSDHMSNEDYMTDIVFLRQARKAFDYMTSKTALVAMTGAVGLLMSALVWSFNSIAYSPHRGLDFDVKPGAVNNLPFNKTNNTVVENEIAETIQKTIR